ncbi:hypothetical protein AK812_SmicGene23936 [Symbiodinium microadriaticum]|uniref:Uncharacterized protein n=1 Tax=Symbiodinium microadriaticum TaxID=2951 RepID=A0A1Q9DFV7_SYMMI|nr:hypothetical protein AK812_SmicGene23936 [Symbiodinium microadriaticum]
MSCLCCGGLDESSKYEVKPDRMIELFPSLDASYWFTTSPVDELAKSIDAPEQLGDTDLATELPINQRAQSSDGIEDCLQPPTSGVTLTFRRPNGLYVDVDFESRPLGLRFSDTTPLTVTHVRSDYDNTARVSLGWVVTHVNKQQLPRSILDANAMVRDAVSQLPRATRTKSDLSAADVAPTKQRDRQGPSREANLRAFIQKNV